MTTTTASGPITTGAGGTARRARTAAYGQHITGMLLVVKAMLSS